MTVRTATPQRLKKEGDIGSVFAQFSGGGDLPAEFAQFKREIVSSPELERKITASWQRLLARLETVTAEIEANGSEVGDSWQEGRGGCSNASLSRK